MTTVGVHRSHRYVPLVVWKWALGTLFVLFWVLADSGIWWQGLVLDAVVVGGLVLVGQLPPSSGLVAVEVGTDALRLRVAGSSGPITIAWPDVLDVVFVKGTAEERRLGATRTQLTLHHACVLLLVRDQTEPLVLVHVRRPQQLAVRIAGHAAAARAAAAGTARS